MGEKGFFSKMMTVKTGVSSMRWVFVWTVAVSIIVPLFTWAYVYVQDHTADIPAGVVALALGAIGGSFTGKVWQSYSENDADEPTHKQREKQAEEKEREDL